MAKKRSAQATRNSNRSTVSARPLEPQPTGPVGREIVRGVDIAPSELERALLLDEKREEIAAVVGEEYAETLRQLALEANQAQSRGGKRVLILPGILGSTLAVNGNTIWFDPVDIARGKLTLLKLAGTNDNVESIGVFWPTYTELYLKLKIAGYRPEYFHFDWRRPIAEAANRLAKLITQSPGSSQPVSLVAHSMGGLVCRAAIKELGAKADTHISQTILLGTPNFGSYAPAMVFTNDYSTVQWMERLDMVNTGGSLVSDVFSTFVGLAEMLPESSIASGIDLFDVDSYPTYLRAARKEVLRKAARLQSRLAKGSDKIWMIAGVGLDTVVGVTASASDPGKFQYQRSPDGDGTVPLTLAMLDGANHRFCNVGHGALPRDNEVIRATVDLLTSGTTSRLSDQPDHVARSASRRSEGTARSIELLERAKVDDRKGSALTDTELQFALEPLLSIRTEQQAPLGSSESVSHSTQPIVLGRKYQSRLDLRLILGDIGETRGRAIMLGIFKDVRPGGAAGSLDKRLDGMLAEVIDRRMFSANVGEVFILPTPRQGLKAEMVVLIGLGTFGQFSAQSLRSSVENATRTLLSCNVDDLVTVPLGGGSGLRMDEISQAMLEGVNAALKDAHGRPSLRSLNVATNNRNDYDHLCQSILNLAATSKFDGIEFTLDREVQENMLRTIAPQATSLLTSAYPTTYLIVRETPNPQSTAKRKHFVDVSVLGTGAKATVLSGEIEVPENDLKQLLLRINDAKEVGGFYAKTAGFGQQLSDLVLPPVIRDLLAGGRPESVTVINDFWGSKIPWELLAIGDWKAGLDGNLSRKYSTSNISVAKWLHSRRRDKSLEMLLVINPTLDLPGAEKEGDRIVKMVESQKAMNLTRIFGADATKDRLAHEFASGKYDLVHYAGHAYFDDKNRSQSGILCAGNQVLSGRELATLDSLPALVVFNACESARVRSATLPARMAKSSTKPKKPEPIDELIDRNVSLAEAFLRGGVASFVGTYWPVGDTAADLFARDFYTAILSGQSISESLLAARSTLYGAKEADWVNYIHYGDAAFKVKVG
jgi:pimeloyl-ACP methyl ester carboxylesterase